MPLDNKQSEPDKGIYLVPQKPQFYTGPWTYCADDGTGNACKGSELRGPMTPIVGSREVIGDFWATIAPGEGK
jgi:hypothetical protein